MTRMIKITILYLVSNLLFIGCGGSTNQGTSSINICEDKEIAYKEAQVFVKVYLKSPSSAVFPTEAKDHTYLGDCKHSFVSYVDAENSFGAMLRKNWKGTVTYSEDRKEWVTHEIFEFW